MLRNCPEGSETVREEPKKAQKLSGRSLKRLKNCLGGAEKARKLSGRSPKKLRNGSGGAQKSSETVREEHKKAQNPGRA